MNKTKLMKKKIIKGKYLLLMFLPCFAYFIIFKYAPMWGLVISFQDYSPFRGISNSPWVGLKNFNMFFQSKYAYEIIRNTLTISFYSLVIGFPMPIILALILNEVNNIRFKKLIQTVTFMPHFLSTVIVTGMIISFLSPTTGIINHIVNNLGFGRINFMNEARWFRPIYIASEMWQHTGWSSIIYIAAITNLDPQLREAAIVDGANKFKILIHVTLPSIMPTIIIVLLLNVGRIMSVGFERAYLLQTPATYSTSDIIQTFVYRQGFQVGRFSYAAAIGMFNSIVNFLLLTISNKMARKFQGTSLW